MPTLILGFGIGAVAIVQGGIFLFYLALCMLLSGRLFYSLEITALPF